MVTQSKDTNSKEAPVLARLFREHWMLAIAAVAAIASMVAVPPDRVYLDYFDWETIGCLFCVLAVGCALRRIGAFDRVARTIIGLNRQPRTIVFAMVVVTSVFSMAFTNDIALIIMLPLSASVIVGMRQVVLLPTVFALQALAANLCGMIMPFGNPQNLYLYSRYQLELGEFFGIMMPPFFVSLVGIMVVTWLLTSRARIQMPSVGMNEDSRMPLDSRRLLAYCVLFAITLLAVFRVIPLLLAVVVIAATIAISDRRTLAEVDYALLATFLFFFIFAGNMSRLPFLENVLTPLMNDAGLLTSALTSQVISNVPAAVILSHFTEGWQALLVGVNIGGAGTFVGSLASLIAIRYFSLSRKVFAPLREPGAPTMGRFLIRFGLLNAVFFVGLLLLFQFVL